MSGEQRASPREKLELPVKLSDGSMAVTYDLSASGLCLRLSGQQAVADDVSFRLHVADAHLTFAGDGKVVRRELCDGATCVSIRFITARLIPTD